MPPQEFSLLDHFSYVPSLWDQTGHCEDHCGNCWSWACTGALETDMAYRNNISEMLSVQYFGSNYHNGTGIFACCGGAPAWFADFYTHRKMAIPWSNANASFMDGCTHCGESTRVPAKSIASVRQLFLSRRWTTQVVPAHFDEGAMDNQTAISNIKGATAAPRAAVIFNYALDALGRLLWSSGTLSLRKQSGFPGRGSSYSGGPDKGAHTVLCLGYNDTDPNNRYWILLNSWGAPNNRPHGLFLLSMDLNYSCCL